jgi:acyl-coenzyme A thioesterase PaaI-like protein
MGATKRKHRRAGPRETDPIRLEILDRAMHALAENRNPGYHFAGHFMGLRCTRFEREGVVLELPAGPHCMAPDGTVDMAAIAFLADMALASANRKFLASAVRTATLTLELKFTGVPARGTLIADVHSDGFSDRTALPQALSRGTITSDGQVICLMYGTWVAPPAPGGVRLAPLPWERNEAVSAPVLGRGDLDAMERSALRRVRTALDAAAADGRGFLRHFWTPKAVHRPHGAVARMPVGLYIGNRVGHVQGGLLFNVAVASAVAAVPRHPVLTAAAAWYISPGQGRALTARSTVLQSGRNVAVVRTELYATGRRRVLEVLTNHAIRPVM